MRLALPLTFVLFLISCQAPTVTPTVTPPRINPDPVLTLPTTQADWYKDQVFYHVWLKGFRDSDGSGVGDLAGVTEKLPYLQDLGVTALWLSPFFQNASTLPNLHGYDVTDHYRVDARFGTLNDVKTLLKAAHDRGMRVIFDFVPNHVSNQHPWFQDSLNNRNGKKDWFVWRSSRPTQGWATFGGGPGSGFHGASNGQFYYGIFWDGMPDLNYRNPAVQTAMEDVAAYWLNLGFDGLRVDAVKYLFEDEATGANVDRSETMAWFQKVRSQVLDPYAAAGAAKFMVAENWTSDGANLQSYLRSGGKDGFQATLDFPQGEAIAGVLNSGAAPSSLETLYNNWVKPANAAGGWTFSFLSNHDNYQSRPLTSFGSVQKSRVALALQLASWGTPILYYGNEIGMTGTAGSDLNLRANFDWSQVASAQADPDSLLRWQKTLNQLRADRPSLRRGSFQVIPSATGTVALVRTSGAESTLLVANLLAASASVSVDLAGLSLGSSIGTLVGTPPTLSGSTLTASLEPFGIGFYALEGPATAYRGPFTDGAPTTRVWAGAKDGSAAVLTASFFDAEGVLLGTRQPSYTGNGGYWWASFPVPATVTNGFVKWTKASAGYQSPPLPFVLDPPGKEVVLGYPHHNTGSSPTWRLRGIAGDWNTGLAMTALDAEADPGHFVATLSAAQAPATGVVFKINAASSGWDYFFGFSDLEYEPTLGDAPGPLGWSSAGGADDNISFFPDGTHAYEVHFLNQKGTCKVWIKKVLP